MVLATPEIIRQRIKSISDIDRRVFFSTIFVYSLRVGEACALKYDSDTEANPTGIHLKARKDIYQPDPADTDNLTLMTLAYSRFRELGRALSYDEIFRIREEVLVLEVTLEKRKGTVTRETAVPLNPKFEPFTQEIWRYFRKYQDSPRGVFPVYRQWAYYHAKRIFDDLEYVIPPYEKLKLDENKKRVTKTDEYGRIRFEYESVNQHLLDCSDHGLRHARTDELTNKYKIMGKELDTYTGWVPSRRGDTGGSMQDRYAQKKWAIYMPKLLVRRM